MLGINFPKKLSDNTLFILCELVHFFYKLLKKNMHTHFTSLNFVRDKIRNIGSALFYSDQDSVLKFPTSIITALKVDEVGQVWFYMNRPSQYIHQFDTQFPARLDFFRK